MITTLEDFCWRGQTGSPKSVHLMHFCFYVGLWVLNIILTLDELQFHQCKTWVSKFTSFCTSKETESLQSRNIHLMPASRSRFPWLPVVKKDVHDVCVSVITNWQVHKFLWNSVVFQEVTVVLCTLHNTLEVNHTLAAMITNDKTSGFTCLVVTLHTHYYGYDRDWEGLCSVWGTCWGQRNSFYNRDSVFSVKYKLRLKNITPCH